jgi:hypothetical protein
MKIAFSKLSGQRKLLIFSSSALFSLSLFLILPLDLFLKNNTAFNIPFIYVFLPLLAASLLVFAVNALLFPLIFSRFRGNAIDVVMYFNASLTLACYVQLLLLNGRMADLVGAGVNFPISFPNMLNLIIWLSIAFAIPLFLGVFAPKREKLKDMKWGSWLCATAAVILGMQLAGIVSSLSGYVPFVSERYYLSYDLAFELSQNENIIVLMPDNLDVAYMDELLELHPELHEQLDGFTYFRNNLSVYSNTFPSVTHLLTHEGASLEFNNDWSRYFEHAWGQRNFIDDLRDGGYITTLLPDGVTTFGSVDNVLDRADNARAAEVSEFRIRYDRILSITLRMSFARVAPYLYKETFVDKIGLDFSNRFTDGELEDRLPHIIGPDADFKFCERLHSVGLSTPHTENVFTFAHFSATHREGLAYDSDSNRTVRYDGTKLDSGRAFFGILSEYITQLKELGIYDNSTIIIIPDHGSLLNAEWRRPVVRTILDNTLLSSVNASLLIKPRDARGELRIDSDAELSHINFAASVLEFAGLPHSEFGESYDDIIRNGGTQTRTFNLMRFVFFGEIYPHTTYIISGDASDFENWIEVEVAEE